VYAHRAHPFGGVEAETAILGAGGHGHDIALTLPTWSDVYDDGHSDLPDIDTYPGGDFIIGVNDSRTRRLIAERLARRGVTARGVWVHPRSMVRSSFVGNHTHINGGAFATRARLGDFVTVGPNATVCGDVTIGDGVMLGAGAVVCEFCVVGEWATIGAGAVVKPRTIVPAGETWVGVPAGPVR
jgi:hypothetical protein